MRWFSLLAAVLTLLAMGSVRADLLTKAENEMRLQQCGKAMTKKVLDGRKIKQSEAPWSIYVSNADKACTGTIISSRHILTATHCFSVLQNDGWTQIVSGHGTLENHNPANCKDGSYYITDKRLLDNVNVVADYKEIAYNPERVTFVNGCKPKNLTGSKPAFQYEDLAIIDLYEDLDLAKLKLQMACVSDSEANNAPGKALSYNGYGLDPSKDPNVAAYDKDKPTAGILRHEDIVVQIMPNLTDRVDPSFFIARNNDNLTVACSGDSGGGAVATDNGIVTVVGALSQTSCDQDRLVNITELYASVGYYADSICKETGICKSGEYEQKLDAGYVRPKKVVRPARPATGKYMVIGGQKVKIGPDPVPVTRKPKQRMKKVKIPFLSGAGVLSLVTTFLMVAFNIVIQ